MERVGILGGTFNPIHLGHLAMADAVMKELRLRRILIIPDGDPPHKSNIVSGKDRLNMARIAVEGIAGLEVSDIEVRRKGTTYTVDTLRELHKLEQDFEYEYIVGSDTFFVIESWREFASVAQMLVGIAVVPRPGTDPEELEQARKKFQEKYPVTVHILNKAVSPVSSTEIRERAARHMSLESYVPQAVEHYIRTHRLYTTSLLEKLNSSMTPARYQHTLGVEETAVELAKLNNVDVEKARLAALLHDCAKHLDMREMLRVVHKANIDTAQGEEESRALLHAAAGMAMARDVYQVTDPDVLSAIRWHTTGNPGMSKLDQVIYLADLIEPGRKLFPGLEEIREMARLDLDKAMLMAARRTVDYVRSRDMPLNERTLKLLETLEQNEKEKKI